MAFDLPHYLATSGPLDTSGIDWEAAAGFPVSPGEVRCLNYMMDIESHTIMYMRDLLNTRAVVDPDISAFLACWVYEESCHGRAFERFLQTIGHPVSAGRVTEVRESNSWRATLDLLSTFAVSRLSRHFTAAYLTWGAINELSTLEGYRQLSRKTENPVLRELVQRVMRDEARHFAFYYHEAERRLDTPAAQRFTSLLLRRFWDPVGSSIKPRDDVNFMSAFLFGGDSGRDAVRRIETAIRKLPGLGWFDLVEKAVTVAAPR